MQMSTMVLEVTQTSKDVKTQAPMMGVVHSWEVAC